jgi:hypothetical protein
MITMHFQSTDNGIYGVVKIFLLYITTEQVDVIVILDTCTWKVFISNLRQDTDYLDWWFL